MRVCPECGEVYPDRVPRCRVHARALRPWIDGSDPGTFTDVEVRGRAVVTPFKVARSEGTDPVSGEVRRSDTPRALGSTELARMRTPGRGLVLGQRYRLSRQLGVGGYGAVFAADDQLTGDRVAVKVLSPAATTSAELVTRFHREAIATSRVRHPHIVQVADFDVDTDGSHFMIMECLDGRDLAEALASERRLPPGRALVIAAQCARGLAAAHRVGVLHRDLKPSNVFLVRRSDGDESVKIIDFGISKLTRAAGDYTNVTSASSVVGTPSYMAPEQARGEELDARCDVYALGVVLFEMVVGARPFAGPDPLATLVAHARAPRVAPSVLRPELAGCPGLDALVVRAIAAERSRRFDSMDELCEAILACLRAIDPAAAENVTAITGELTRPETMPSASELTRARAAGWRRGVGLALGAVAIATVAAVGVWRREDGELAARPPTPSEAEAEVRAPIPVLVPVLIPGAAPAPAPGPAARGLRMVRLTSTPPGAAVHRDGRRLGITPLELALDDDHPAQPVTVTAPGHRPRLVVVASGREHVDVALVPVPVANRRPPRGAAALGVEEW